MPGAGASASQGGGGSVSARRESSGVAGADRGPTMGTGSCHRTAPLETVAMVRSASWCYRSQFKKAKMKEEEEQCIVCLGEDQRRGADEQGPGRPGLGSGLTGRRWGEALVRAPERRQQEGDPAPGSGDMVQPPGAGRAGPSGLHAARGETRLLWGSEPGRDIL